MTRLTTMASTGRLIKRSVNFILAILGLGSWIVPGFNLVVDSNRRAVAQLEHPGAHHFIPRIHARDHRHLVTARAFNFHELLAHSAIALSFLILEVGNNKDRVSVRCVADRGRRQRHRRAAVTLPASAISYAPYRSEEHTSELQSLTNLV